LKVRVNILNKGVSIPQEVLDACGGDELVARIFTTGDIKSGNYKADAESRALCADKAG